MKTELSESEKRELVMTVYPRLRKRSKVMKLLRIGQAVFFCLIFVSCASTGAKPEISKAEKTRLIGMQIKKGMSSGDDPAEYEKVMPHSDVLLSSVVRFSKEPTVKMIADDVVDLDYEAGLLVLLKSDRIETNRIDCPAVLLKDKPISIRLENGLALVTGPKKSVIADIAQCGLISEMDSAGKGFSLSDKYFLEFSKNSFSFYDPRNVQRIFGGSFLGSVFAGDLSGENAMFANENGKIAIMNVKSRRYTAIYPESIDIKQLSFQGDDIYVFDSENRLTRLSADFSEGLLKENGTAQAKDGCFFLKRSGRLFCDGYIFGLESAYKSPIEAEKGLIRDGLIFLIKDRVVYFIDVVEKYKKSIVFGQQEKKLCLKDGKAYFTDFNNIPKYISASGVENKAISVPETCDHTFGFQKGALRTPDGKVIYTFAEEVNRSEKAVMLKRVLDGEIYYYFERLSD